MFRTYFKTAWRNLSKNKTFAAINIIGLSVGIAVFLLIASFLRFEYSYDDMHQLKDRLYRVPMVIQKKGEKEQASALTYPALAPALKEDFPEIEEVVRLANWGGMVTYQENLIADEGSFYYAEPAFFRIFDFKFIRGNASTAFKELNDAVITTETAEKFFGDADPIGKVLHYLGKEYTISAVVELPPNTHLRFDLLFNHDKLSQRIPLHKIWGQPNFYTYVLLKPGANAASLQAKLPSFAERHVGADMERSGNQISFVLQPIKDIHVRSPFDYEMEGNGNFTYHKYLAFAALLILLIAWINYINLSTAISLDRFKEVGVKKVIGATKFQLVHQFLTESLVLNIVAILLGILIFQLALPSFSNLVERQVIALNTSDSTFWLFSVILLLLGTLLAAFYPAFVLSSFKPVYAIKSSGSYAGWKGGKSFLRESLVVLQFIAAIVLIAGAIGFYRQLSYMQTRDLGIDIEQTLVLKKPLTWDSSYIQINDAFISELSAHHSIVSATTSSDVPGNDVGSVNTALKRGSVEKSIRGIEVDNNFISAYGLKIVAGRDFLPTERRAVDTAYVQSVIANEAAVKLYGFSKPSDLLGQELLSAGFIRSRVVGVVKNFNQRSLQNDYDPLFLSPVDKAAWQNLSLKINTRNLPELMDFIQAKWSSFYPGMPFQYFFLDDHFNEQYKNDRMFASVIWLFTLIAIVIACLGLFALSLFTITKRSKEISVRKVLGATASQIAILISKDYMRLVVIAAAIALPLAFLLVKNWLEDYAFRIDIGGWFFILPAFLIILIALITVLYQSIKAANANPVNNLRTE